MLKSQARLVPCGFIRLCHTAVPGEVSPREVPLHERSQQQPQARCFSRCGPVVSPVRVGWEAGCREAALWAGFPHLPWARLGLERRRLHQLGLPCLLVGLASGETGPEEEGGGQGGLSLTEGPCRPRFQ